MNDDIISMSAMGLLVVVALALGCGTAGTDDEGSDSRSCTSLETSDDIEGGAVLDDDCYTVSGLLSISSGELKIEPGTTLYFDSDAGLSIEQSARLSAVGTGSEPVELRGDQTELGFWRGIRLAGAGPHLIEGARIAHGGSSSWDEDRLVRRGGVVVSDNTAEVQIVDSRFEQHEFASLVTDAPLAEVEVSQTRFEQSDAPMRVHPNHLDGLGAGLSFADHRDEVVFVHGDEVLSRDGSWRPLAVPYHFQEVVVVESAVTIEPDTVVEFGRHAGLDFDGGSLSIDAVDGGRVHLQGANDTSGYWRGLRFRNMSAAASELRYVDILHAGSQRWEPQWSNSQAAILVDDGGHLIVNNTRIVASNYHGISVRDGLVEGCNQLELEDIYRHETHSYEDGEVCQ